MRSETALPFSPRDLYFVASHQAAQVVAALMLGCRVGDVQLGNAPDAGSWGFDNAPEGDVETVCAAGYAMELSMNRLPEKAWPLAEDDRRLLGSLHYERTGVELDAAGVDERFRAGVESSTAILEHPAGKQAIERVAAALGDAYLAGRHRMSGDEVRAVVDGLL